MDPSDFDTTLRELWEIISGEWLRNLLTSGRVIAELARVIYERLVTTTQAIEAATPVTMPLIRGGVVIGGRVAMKVVTSNTTPKSHP